MRTTAVLTAMLAAFAFGTSAAASPPTHGSGIGTILVRSTTTINTADGNVIQERHTDGVLTGFFDGAYDLTVRGVVHHGEFVTFHGLMTFTGAAADCGVGTIVLEFEGKALPGLPISEGRMRTIDSAENTIDVHVVGTFQQTATVFSYDGDFHCGPE